MKLTDSEALFLLQLLFHVKSSSGFGLEDCWTRQSIDDLHGRLKLYFGDDACDEEKEGSLLDTLDQFANSGCEDCSHDEALEEASKVDVEQSLLFDLETLSVLRNEEKKKLKFVDGTKGMVDIELDDGDEIICDVTKIVRRGKEVHMSTAGGWEVFFVQRFPASWASALPLDTTCSVGGKE